MGMPRVEWSWHHKVKPHALQELLPLPDGVFVGAGRTVAVLGENGAPQWVRVLDEPVDWLSAVPESDVMVGGAVDQSSRHGVTAVSLRTGKLLWHTKHQLERITLAGVLVRTTRGVALLDARAGTMTWSLSGARSVAVAEGAVVVSTATGLVAVDLETGTKVWSEHLDQVQEVVGVGSSVLVSETSAVRLVSARSGVVAWSRPVKLGAQVGAVTPTTAFVMPVVSGQEDGAPETVHIVDGTGEDVASLRVTGPFTPTTFLSGEQAYLVDGQTLYDDHLRKLGEYDGGPITVADGGLYTVTDTAVSFYRLGSAEPDWTLPFPDGGGIPTIAVPGALYTLTADGVRRYS